MSELLVCPDPASASDWCLQQRQAGRSIGLVPTMGALHEGHLTLVVKDLARHFGFPEIRVCPTQQEDNGLAMSSRNQRLTSEQRLQAGGIYQALLAAQQAWQAGERWPEQLREMMLRVHLSLSK